jgi:hypothetical protein
VEGRKRVVPIGSSCFICWRRGGVSFWESGRWRKKKMMMQVRAPIGRLRGH